MSAALTDDELTNLESDIRHAGGFLRDAVWRLIEEVRAARKAKEELNSLCDDQAVSTELIGIRIRNERLQELASTPRAS